MAVSFGSFPSPLLKPALCVKLRDLMQHTELLKQRLLFLKSVIPLVDSFLELAAAGFQQEGYNCS